MGEGVLSQAEVENLLNSMGASTSAATTDGPAAAAPSPAATIASSAANKLREKVMTYDFKRPERVGK